MSVNNVLYSIDGQPTPARPVVSPIEVSAALERCWSTHCSELGLFLNSNNILEDLAAMIVADSTRNVYHLACSLDKYLKANNFKVEIDWKSLLFLDTFLRFVAEEESTAVRNWFQMHRPICPAEIGDSVYDKANNRILQVESIYDEDCGVASCRGLDENGCVTFVYMPFETLSDQKEVIC